MQQAEGASSETRNGSPRTRICRGRRRTPLSGDPRSPMVRATVHGHGRGATGGEGAWGRPVLTRHRGPSRPPVGVRLPYPRPVGRWAPAAVQTAGRRARVADRRLRRRVCRALTGLVVRRTGRVEPPAHGAGPGVCCLQGLQTVQRKALLVTGLFCRMAHRLWAAHTALWEQGELRCACLRGVRREQEVRRDDSRRFPRAFHVSMIVFM